MLIENTEINDVKVVNPLVHKDNRGYLFESYSLKSFKDNGLPTRFVQDNQVSSKKGEVSANLFSSKKLDEKTISEIEKEISENVNGTIKLKSKVDETLIGGIVLQIGSLMIDTSIKNKLANYKKVLMEN